MVHRQQVLHDFPVLSAWLDSHLFKLYFFFSFRWDALRFRWNWLAMRWIFLNCFTVLLSSLFASAVRNVRWSLRSNVRNIAIGGATPHEPSRRAGLAEAPISATILLAQSLSPQFMLSLNIVVRLANLPVGLHVIYIDVHRFPFRIAVERIWCCKLGLFLELLINFVLFSERSLHLVAYYCFQVWIYFVSAIHDGSELVVADGYVLAK